ncbi:MAG: 50S ribosomal protein L9 [Candidatus Magasanikbacteria bacterium RIFOXYD2_FULL_39_9]|uniref:Large ribosomal subunit protein bL9 n=1 Tax=Candidatus Magasanikbacteria bacterium RIFOXYD1_FULL_40_23 TaxID=1798705 RepID=A0A1F6PAJ9_9BACT|nr:MAG: 50S ribosomal protein L9 [Candidatus Magasanikbacteria bacterium RIFOXYD2_FULL_39_9]OGH93201.1 MAG: 50S ribosomal protein L9 [Candidatus Magasanikbacteria bacterium RIFOXYD1_FULL_40_23]
MRVILIQNVPGLGKIDDIKEASEGYSRNFLFAKNLAIPATAKALQEVEARRNRQVKDLEQDLRGQQSLADKLDGFEINIKEKVSASGALYASVGPQKISEMLAKSGFKIDKNQIIIKPVKEVGEYKATIKFAHGLEAEIIVNVIKL